MSSRKYVSSGTSWEGKVGYSRAIRVGNQIEVSGTIAYTNEQMESIDDAYGQTMSILKKISDALEELGASMNDVIRTRIYVTDITRWEEVGNAHGEYFKDIRPATSMVEVSNLIEKDALVEIEATALIN